MKKIDEQNLKRDIKEKRELINMTMDRFLPRKDDFPKEIHKAIRHSLFAGGKRIRPYLTLLCYQLFKKNITNDVLMAASAIEFLHTYTLIHDDLPEIDNDDYRRGKKTCHVVYGSSIALLAGDALMIEAFYILNSMSVTATKKIKMLRDMATLCGDRGVIAGQMQDIISQGKSCDKSTLEFIQLNKTTKLFQLCTRYGAYMADVTVEDMKKMDEFGKKLGTVFQIVDDILDVEGSTASMGKTVGKDENVKKATYPSVFGMKKSKDMVAKYTKEAMSILDEYGDRAKILKELTLFLTDRKN
jgi:geranylgeranyl diphosphate synthase type II